MKAKSTLLSAGSLSSKDSFEKLRAVPAAM